MKRTIALTILLLSTSSNSEQSKPIPFSQLPKPVVNAISEIVPTDSIRQIEQILISGKNLYEVETKSHDQTMDITLSPDGHIFEIEQPSTLAELSLNAKQAIREKFSLLEVIKVESVQLNYHEVEGTINGVDVELKVYASGKITVRPANVE